MTDSADSALLGFGPWGKNIARVLSQMGRLRLICDINSTARQAAHEEYPTLKIQKEIETVLQDAEIQAVFISTPPATHYELARVALESGKDVFVEKPLALQYEDGEEICRLAQSKGRILMVGHILAYHPAVVRLKELIHQGKLGHLQYLYSNRLNLGRIRREENILWSFAPHDISTILSLTDALPVQVSAHGSSYISADIADVTLSTLDFPHGIRAHLFVSWLHPFKEHKLVVIGSEGMAVFDDTIAQKKLILYPHRIEWKNQFPVAHKADGENIPIENQEPLWRECSHFFDRMADRKKPLTDGALGLQVLKVLQACQQSLEEGGRIISISSHTAANQSSFIHPTAMIDPGVTIGEGVKIWHFSHIMTESTIGSHTTIGQNVFVGEKVQIGKNVKIQNNVSIYSGVTLDDEVFCGPSCVFTNVMNPRSTVPRKKEFQPTLVKKGATIGANSTIVCGVTIGRYAFVGAGAVVTKDIPDYALVVGNPARITGWMCACGVKVSVNGKSARCTKCGLSYRKELDRLVPENSPSEPGENLSLK